MGGLSSEEVTKGLFVVGIPIMRIATLSLALVLGMGVGAHADTSTLLQNETLVNGQAGAIQLGFLAGDIGAAVLEASPGDYPLNLCTVQILIADSTGIPLNTVRDYVITIYDNGNVNPGSPIFTSAPTTLGANVFTELDVSAQGIVINSGKFTVGARPVSGALPAEPNLVTSINGCQTGKNRIRDVNSGLWFDGCNLGISGQLAIRATVLANGGGGGGNPPSVSVLVPNEGDPAGGETITVFGADFVSGATVTFDGTPAPAVTFLSSNALEVVTPAGSAGPVDIEVCNPDLQCGSLADGFTYLELECFAGNITPTTDILFVNGSAGGAGRTVSVEEGTLLIASIVKPPAGGNGKFLVHTNFGAPNETTETVLPAQIGTFCFPVILQQGGDPDAVWNNIGKENRVGASMYFDGSPLTDPDRAPTSFLELFSGDTTNLPAGTTATFQAVIIDPDSPSAKGAATSNAVILEVTS